MVSKQIELIKLFIYLFMQIINLSHASCTSSTQLSQWQVTVGDHFQKVNRQVPAIQTTMILILQLYCMCVTNNTVLFPFLMHHSLPLTFQKLFTTFHVSYSRRSVFLLRPSSTGLCVWGQCVAMAILCGPCCDMYGM